MRQSMRAAKSHLRLLAWIVATVVAVVLLWGTALTWDTVLAEGEQLAIPWFSVDGGGGTVAAGGYTLLSAVGQADAGALNGPGGYSLVGGVLAAGTGGAIVQDQKVYLPAAAR